MGFPRGGFAVQENLVPATLAAVGAGLLAGAGAIDRVPRAGRRRRDAT